MLSAVACLRSEAGEPDGILIIELAEGEHSDECGGGGEHADTGNGNKDIEARGERGISVQTTFRVASMGHDLTVDLRKPLCGMTLERRCKADMLAAIGCSSVLDQC